MANGPAFQPGAFQPDAFQTEPAVAVPVGARYDTGSDLLAYVLRRAGEILPIIPAGDARVLKADRLIEAMGYINEAQVEIAGMRAWHWARSWVQWNVPPSERVHVQSITGNTVTFAQTPRTEPAEALFQLLSEPSVYAVAGGSGNVWLLDVPYVGTARSGDGYIVQADIPLPDDFLAHPWVYDSDWQYGTPVRGWQDQWTEWRRWGWRRGGGWVGLGTSRAVMSRPGRIMILPYSESPRTVVFGYTRRPAPLTFDGNPVTDTPIVPKQGRRGGIGNLALERLFLDRRDARLDRISRELRDTITLLQSQETAITRPRLYVPRGHRVNG
jgi:hypothetical protein